MSSYVNTFTALDNFVIQEKLSNDHEILSHLTDEFQQYNVVPEISVYRRADTWDLSITIKVKFLCDVEESEYLLSRQDSSWRKIASTSAT